MEGTAGAGYAGFAEGTADVFDEDGPEPLPVAEPVVVAREAFWAAASGDCEPLHIMKPASPMPAAIRPPTSARSIGFPRPPPRASSSEII